MNSIQEGDLDCVSGSLLVTINNYKKVLHSC